jgi:hypothetical protein
MPVGCGPSGVSAGLALVPAISIFLLRRSAPGTAEPVT